VLDEPMNGLDPDGIADMRRTIQALPQRNGVTVFLSSHLLSEVQQVATHIGLMRQGRLVVQGRMAELLTLTTADVFVRARQRSSAVDALAAFGFDARAEGDGLVVAVPGKGMNAGRVAEILVQFGVEILEMTPRQGTLEDLYGRVQQLAVAA
jgi:ABC-2 type transport system ATP-binding protein